MKQMIPGLGVAAATPTRCVLDGLRRRHNAEKQNGETWAFFEEMRIGTGYGKGLEQRIDAWAMHLWPSGGLMRIAYEVKVSRADFLAEVKSPKKRRAALLLSNFYFFATPKGLLRAEEIPIECGLIEIDTTSETLGHKIVVDAPFRDSMFPTWPFVAALMRRLARDEMHLNRVRTVRP